MDAASKLQLLFQQPLTLREVPRSGQNCRINIHTPEGTDGLFSFEAASNLIRLAGEIKGFIRAAFFQECDGQSRSGIESERIFAPESSQFNCEGLLK